MFAPFRSTRLLFIGLAACAVTWAMAAGALAKPIVPVRDEVATDSRAAANAPRSQSQTRPAFKVVAGDVKEPEAGSRPDFTSVVGDVKSDADRARAVPPIVPNNRVSVPAAPSDDTSTIALILSIAAIVTALGAVTLTVTRPTRGALRA